MVTPLSIGGSTSYGIPEIPGARMTPLKGTLKHNSVGVVNIDEFVRNERSNNATPYEPIMQQLDELEGAN